MKAFKFNDSKGFLILIKDSNTNLTLGRIVYGDKASRMHFSSKEALDNIFDMVLLECMHNNFITDHDELMEARQTIARTPNAPKWELIEVGE